MQKSKLLIIFASLVFSSSCAPNTAGNLHLFEEKGISLENAVPIEEFALAQRLSIIEQVGNINSGNGGPQDRINWIDMTAAAGREDILANADIPQIPPKGHTCEQSSDVGALDQIVELAKTNSIVIINEHHGKPRHRAFIQKVITELRPLGFTHYAQESMSPSWKGRTGYPTVHDGYYTTEPMMARLFETANRLGYVQVPYEATLEQMAPFDAPMAEQIEAREEAQAQNLMEAVLAANPDTKIIIHVGFDHVAEEPIPAPVYQRWMAARLKEKSGIDPLTISLTKCHSDIETNVLSTSRKTPNGLLSAELTDYLLGFPPMEFTDGRPNYRYEIGDKPIEVPEALKLRTSPVLIEARPPGADFDQEPIERLYLAPGEDLPLLLPVGTWSLVAIDNAGNISEPIEVTVE